MPQKSWNKMTNAEKFSLLIGDDVFAFPHEDPEVAIDYCGCSGTLDLSQYIDIVNNSTWTLYFRVVAEMLSGDSSKWSGTTIDLATISANNKGITHWTPKREVPTVKITETFRVWLKAYRDVDKTILHGEDYTDFTYYFFNHLDGAMVDFCDFETGGDGWEGNLLYRRTSYPYTGAFHLVLVPGTSQGLQKNGETDSSGQAVPSKETKIYKTYNLSGYSSAFLVLHITRYWKNGDPVYSYSRSVMRIWTSTGKEYFIRIPLDQNAAGYYRVAVPLPTQEHTVYITALWTADYEGGAPHNVARFIALCTDTFIVVGFS